MANLVLVVIERRAVNRRRYMDEESRATLGADYFGHAISCYGALGRIVDRDLGSHGSASVTHDSCPHR